MFSVEALFQVIESSLWNQVGAGKKKKAPPNAGEKEGGRKKGEIDREIKQGRK